MGLADHLREQAIPQLRHCYIRYQALLAQLHGEAWDGSGPGRPSLLQHLQAAYGPGGSLGAAETAAAAVLLAPSSGGSSFERTYAQEVERVRLFLKSSLEQLWLALLEGCAQLRALSEELLQGGETGGQHPHQLDVRLATLKAGFDATAAEVVLIDKFLRQNVAACAQLAQMFDQQQQLQGQQQQHSPAAAPSELPLEAVDGAYLAAAQAALLGDLSLEALLLGLSDAYELCRLVESDAAALAGRLGAKWVPPDKFERVTRKFWVHPADVTRLKAEIIRHLPILLFGDRQKLTEGSPYRVAFLRDQRGVSDSADITSVYYDDDSLSTYHDRLRKDDGASAVRLRWYGERSLCPDQRIFVERKVHRERYTGERSYKERAPLAQRYVADFTSGVGGPPELVLGAGSSGGGLSEQQVDFLRDVQRFLLQRRQEPLLRTCCRRTAFQESSNNQVRISLDTQLHVVREAGAPRAPGDWCRDMRMPLGGAADAAFFPYAVVEIKLQAAPPDWVQGLLHTGMLLPVPKFSKFLHGAALLFQHRCRNVPYWFLPDEHDPRRMSPATWEEMADPADEYLQKGTEWLFPKDFGAALEPEPGTPSDPPYRPAPLRFLRRSKTAPAPASASGGSHGTGSSGAAVQGPQGAAAGAPAEQAGCDAVLWENLRVAGGAPHPAAGQRHPELLPQLQHHAQHVQQQQQPARHLAAPSPMVAAAGLATAGGLAAAAAAAGGAAAEAGHVQRNFTWPVYQSPLALLPPGPERSSNMPAQQQVALPAGQPGGTAAVAQQIGRASPAHSQTSTPIDSAQDLEAGQQAEAGGGNGCKNSRLDGGKPLQAAPTGTSPGQPTASLFSALQFRQLVQPAIGDASGTASPCPSGRVKQLVRTRVEPKTFFANERTFLQWLQISVLIMMTATSLLSGTGLLSSVAGGSSSCNAATDTACYASKLSGAVIAPVAMLFMAYALFMYKKRTYQILRRQTVRYDDQRGPVVLVIILLAVFLLSYILAMVFIF